MPGDRVAIVAPASPFRADELTESLDIARECGLEPVLGPNVKYIRSDGIHAASLDDRVAELMWAYEDPAIQGVIVATGGNGSAGVLPYLDYRVIAQERKVLLGMSDITALNNGILSQAGLITVNGQSPNIRLDRGRSVREADTASFRRTLELLMSSRTWGTTPFEVNQYLPRTLSPGRATGHVIGGNCDTFVHLLGTPYVPNMAGAILFIEDTHKDGGVLARQFLHLKLAGVLDAVAGVIIGEFAEVPRSDPTSDHPSPSIEDVLLEYFADGPPCAYGYSFSHGPTTIPIPIGATCSMDADTGQVSFGFAMAR